MGFLELFLVKFDWQYIVLVLWSFTHSGQQKCEGLEWLLNANMKKAVQLYLFGLLQDFLARSRSHAFCRIDAASELRDIAAEQQAELKSLQNHSPEPVHGCARSDDSACSGTFWREVMQQEQEVNQLRELLLSLQDGFESRQSFTQQSACDVILDKLHFMQQQLISLKEAHDFSLHRQARHSKNNHFRPLKFTHILFDLYPLKSPFCKVLK